MSPAFWYGALDGGCQLSLGGRLVALVSVASIASGLAAAEPAVADIWKQSFDADLSSAPIASDGLGGTDAAPIRMAIGATGRVAMVTRTQLYNVGPGGTVTVTSAPAADWHGPVVAIGDDDRVRSMSVSQYGSYTGTGSSVWWSTDVLGAPLRLFGGEYYPDPLTPAFSEDGTAAVLATRAIEENYPYVGGDTEHVLRTVSAAGEVIASRSVYQGPRTRGAVGIEGGSALVATGTGSAPGIAGQTHVSVYRNGLADAASWGTGIGDLYGRRMITAQTDHGPMAAVATLDDRYTYSDYNQRPDRTYSQGMIAGLTAAGGGQYFEVDRLQLGPDDTVGRTIYGGPSEPAIGADGTVAMASLRLSQTSFGSGLPYSYSCEIKLGVVRPGQGIKTYPVASYAWTSAGASTEPVCPPGAAYGPPSVASSPNGFVVAWSISIDGKHGIQTASVASDGTVTGQQLLTGAGYYALKTIDEGRSFPRLAYLAGDIGCCDAPHKTLTVLQQASNSTDGVPEIPGTGSTNPDLPQTPSSPAPSAGPCAKVNGTLLDKLSASLNCSTAQLVNQAKCGVGVAQWVVLPLKSLQFATTARGYLDLRKISDKRLHSLARFYNRYWKGQHARTNLPNGFKSPAQLISRIEEAQDIYGLIQILAELSDGSSIEEIQQMALDLTDIAGVKACVEGLALAME